MPPKPRYSKEEILDCAFEILKEKGMKSVNARDLGARLAASSRPVFTAYSSMEELKTDLHAKTKEAYAAWLHKALFYTLSYKQIALQMIDFAKREKHLFCCLFMEENSDFGEDFLLPREMTDFCVRELSEDFAISRKDAGEIFRQILLAAFSMACVRKNEAGARADANETDAIGRVITALIGLSKNGKMDLPTMQPVYRGRKRADDLNT